jgi:hypothetical protein
MPDTFVRAPAVSSIACARPEFVRAVPDGEPAPRSAKGPEFVRAPGHATIGVKSTTCPVCQKPCKTLLGLMGHMRSHKK